MYHLVGVLSGLYKLLSSIVFCMLCNSVCGVLFLSLSPNVGALHGFKMFPDNFNSKEAHVLATKGRIPPLHHHTQCVCFLI